MRKIFKDLMYKSGHDYDYQYDWVLKKQGQKIPEDDMIGKPTAGNIANAQGKDDGLKAKDKHNFIEERKETRAALGQQVMNGIGGSKIDKRQSSATKRKP
jgi:hypothetical protein